VPPGTWKREKGQHVNDIDYTVTHVTADGQQSDAQGTVITLEDLLSLMCEVGEKIIITKVAVRA
jgi:hypothetical protein